MTTKEAAWVHPNPLLDSYVVLPDGYQMDRKEAASKGYKIVAWPKAERVATPHQHEPESVVLSRGQVVSRDTAQSAGFTVSARAPEITPDPYRSWRSAILSSPEARDRSSATVELVTTQSHLNLSVEAAQAFLRGLPTETTEEETNVTTNDIDPRAARLAEIQSGMTAFNKGRGYNSAPKAVTKPVQERADIEPAKLQRLTEIRLKGLCQNGRDNSEEAKILRNALDTHHRVGTPLNRALAQHGFDAATLLPKT